MKLGPFYFGYNATEDRGKRQAPKTRVYHEAAVLTPVKRGKLQATAQEQIRNHSLPAWMVRKHLDYVSKFHISFKTDKTDLDTLVNRIFRWHGRPRNLDLCMRYGRDEMFRMFELEKVVSGDAALVKMPGIKLQTLESDLIAKGSGAPDGVNDSGLIVNEQGQVVQYAVCNRGDKGIKVTHDHLEDAQNVIFDAYWTRFGSQFRGVSPLSTAINTVQDIHEGCELNQIKLKMHALFGVAIFRDADDPRLGGAAGSSNPIAWTATAYTWTAADYCVYAGTIYFCNTTHTTTTASVFATDLAAGKWTKDAEGVGLELDPRSINMLDLKPGEQAKVLESSTPSNEFVEGTFLFIQLAMLALDIPVTAFDSRRSSFSARIADLNEYEVSCDSKRTKNRYVRQDYSDWVLANLWNDAQWGLSKVADRHKMTLRDVQESVKWIPSGSPWISKLDQLKGDELGIALAIDNHIDAARRRGVDVFDNIDKIAKVQEYAKAKGVELKVSTAQDRTIGDIVREEVDRESAGQEQPQ